MQPSLNCLCTSCQLLCIFTGMRLSAALRMRHGCEPGKKLWLRVSMLCSTTLWPATYATTLWLMKCTPFLMSVRSPKICLRGRQPDRPISND